jgi:hypothetical protein
MGPAQPEAQAVEVRETQAETAAAIEQAGIDELGQEISHVDQNADMAAIDRSEAAADLAREPSQRPSLGNRGQARNQPNPRTSVRAAAPRSVGGCGSR